MPRRTFSLAEAQSALPRLVREAEKGHVIAITRRNETVAYLVSRDDLDAIAETAALLGNPKARQTIDAHRAGRIRFVGLSALVDG